MGRWLRRSLVDRCTPRAPERWRGTRSRTDVSLKSFLIAQHALELHPEPCRAPLGAGDPVANLPWRVVPDVLAMAALKLGDPVSFVVLMISDDRLLHARAPFLVARFVFPPLRPG